MLDFTIKESTEDVFSYSDLVDSYLHFYESLTDQELDELMMAESYMSTIVEDEAIMEEVEVFYELNRMKKELKKLGTAMGMDPTDLAYDFRLAIDTATGHKIKIVYSLEGMILSQNNVIEDESGYGHRDARQGLTSSQAVELLRKFGNTDHQSYNQKVLAIEDMEEKEIDPNDPNHKRLRNKRLDHVTAEGPFNYQQTDPVTGKKFKPTFDVYVGMVETEDQKSFKSTFWPKGKYSTDHDIYDISNMEGSHIRSRPAHELYRINRMKKDSKTIFNMVGFNPGDMETSQEINKKALKGMEGMIKFRNTCERYVGNLENQIKALEDQKKYIQSRKDAHQSHHLPGKIGKKLPKVPNPRAMYHDILTPVEIGKLVKYITKTARAHYFTDEHIGIPNFAEIKFSSIAGVNIAMKACNTYRKIFNAMKEVDDFVSGDDVFNVNQKQIEAQKQIIAESEKLMKTLKAYKPDIPVTALTEAPNLDSSVIQDSIKPSFTDTLNGMRQSAHELDSTLFSKMRVDNRSIISRVKNSILQFPVYISQSCPVNVANIISQMFGRVYTTYVQMALAMNPILDETDANDMKFLKNFHSNITESANIQKFIEQADDLFNNYFYQPIDEHDAMMQDAIHCVHRINERASIEFHVIPTIDKDLITENARLMNEPLSGFGYLTEAAPGDDPEHSLQITTNANTVSEDELRDRAAEIAGLDRDQRELVDMSVTDVRHMIEGELGRDADPAEIQEALSERLYDRSNAIEALEEALAQLKEDIQNGKIKGYEYDGFRYVRNTSSRKDDYKPRARTAVDDAVPAPMILKEGEIKKINDMLPYTIRATFRLKTARGLDRNVEFIIGIKAVLHLIHIQDLEDELHELVTGKVSSLQKVRYKTGEIDWKEYMFNTKALKADAMKNLDSNKRWLNTLKRLGDYTQQYGSFLKGPIQMINGNIPYPNGTLVLMQPDITTLTNETGIDLSQLRNAKRLANNLFLMAFCIIDASAGTLRVYYPGESDDWSIQSLASVDAENSRTDNSQLMRELNSIVNRR